MALHPLFEQHPEDWERVYSSIYLYRVEILRSLLEEEEIESVIINKQDSSYLAFGDIELYIKRADIFRVMPILNEYMNNE
jgi:hypothetical protein